MREFAHGLTCSKPVPKALRLIVYEMRRNPTPSEAAAWLIVRDRRLFELRFRRQQIIDRFVVDLYCHELRLCIEIDGDIHDELNRIESDEVRTAWLEQLGFRVARIRAEAVAREAFERIVLPHLVRTPKRAKRTREK